MSLLVQLNRNALAETSVGELILVMKLYHTRRIIDLDDKLLDELSPDNAVKVVAETRLQSAQRNCESHWLRKSLQARQCPGSVFHVRSGQRFAACAADPNLALKLQSELFCHVDIDDAYSVAGIEYERQRTGVVNLDLQDNVPCDQLEGD